nr:Retrovirus-related Pol polyprotein from transposon TNT 1-94 [Ipomoea batatas]
MKKFLQEARVCSRQCSKHIDTRYHWIRDILECKMLELEKIHTDDNGSDMMTKALPRGKFEILRFFTTRITDPGSLTRSAKATANFSLWLPIISSFSSSSMSLKTQLLSAMYPASLILFSISPSIGTPNASGSLQTSAFSANTWRTSTPGRPKWEWYLSMLGENKRCSVPVLLRQNERV